MRNIPPPAMPMGAKYDPEATIIENARNAREHHKALRRSQAERDARVLARRVFRTDEFEFEYSPELGQDVPSFLVEDELIIFNANEGTFLLAEFCSECGKEPKGRKFNSLAGLGAAIEERDDEDAHTCRTCLILANYANAKRK